MRRLLLALLAGAAGCSEPAASSAAAPPPSAPETAMPTAAPALPDDVLLQLFWADTGVMYRIANDGQYRVTMPGQPEQVQRPLSYYERGQERLSAPALERLRAAISAANLPSLGEEVPAAPTAGERLVNSGAPIRLRPLVISARHGGRVSAVLVRCDPAAPETMGPLAELYRAVDREALGDWMNE